jgi:hypothetical protein
LAVLMLEMPGDADADAGCSCCQPHPELVMAQRPTPVQVTEVAALLGAWPAGSYLSGDLVVGER